MKKHISHGMILAAGFGTRLRPLTLQRPKPLMEVLGTPLICYALENLSLAGCKQVVINTHHLGNALQQALGSTYHKMALLYSHEDPILGTAGAIKHAERLLGGALAGPFMLIHGDVLCDFSPQTLLEAYYRQPAFAVLGLKTVDDMMEYSPVGTDKNNRVVSIGKLFKPLAQSHKKRFFSGIYMLSPDIFGRLPQDGIGYCLIKECLPIAMKEGLQVYGTELPGYYCDVGTPERLLQANFDLLTRQEKLEHLEPFSRLRRDEHHADVWLGRNTNIHPSANIKGPVLLDDKVTVEAHATVGPYAVIGKNSVLSQHCTIEHSVILSHTTIKADEPISHSIVENNARICDIASG